MVIKKYGRKTKHVRVPKGLLEQLECEMPHSTWSERFNKLANDSRELTNLRGRLDVMNKKVWGAYLYENVWNKKKKKGR